MGGGSRGGAAARPEVSVRGARGGGEGGWRPLVPVLAPVVGFQGPRPAFEACSDVKHD